MMVRSRAFFATYFPFASWLDWVGLLLMLFLMIFTFNFYAPDDGRRWVTLSLFLFAIFLMAWTEEPTHLPFYRGLTVPQLERGRLVLLTMVTLLLIALEANFTILIVLYYILSARTLFVFPNQIGYRWVLLFGIITTVFITRLTWPEWQLGMLNGLGATCGYFFIGSAANAQRRAELANGESQRLLGELQAAHLQLQRYAAHAEAFAVAEERNRVAREMHDTLGHRLTVAAVQLEGAQKLVKRDPAKVETMIATVREQVLGGLAELRQTVAALRTPLEAELPLATALTRLATEFMAATGIVTVLDLPEGMPPLAPDLRQALYRAAQEALTNIQRHAHASHAQIQVTLLTGLANGAGLTGSAILISITDNGVGLVEGDATRGYGLRGLEERATQLGGSVTLQPHHGGGTQVVMRLPFPPPAHQPSRTEPEATNG